MKIAKLNVDDNPDIARRFDVMSIPTLIVFKDGEPEPTKRMVGAKGKGQLLQELRGIPVPLPPDRRLSGPRRCAICSAASASAGVPGARARNPGVYCPGTSADRSERFQTGAWPARDGLV